MTMQAAILTCGSKLENESNSFGWRPQLSCFALRATVEVQQADGTWSLVSEKKALKVTMNHSSARPSLQERSQKSSGI
jgi:hypothetical protein